MVNKFVLDCSVTMTWCLEDETCEYGESVLDSLEHAVAIVPSIWHIEVSNVLYLAKKRNRLLENKLHAFFYELDSLPIETARENITRQNLVALSMEYDLTGYDACYLNLCMTHNLSLATLDKKLSSALIAAGGKLYMDSLK
jgi:predicted nucleic acid-binding protein